MKNSSACVYLVWHPSHRKDAPVKRQTDCDCSPERSPGCARAMAESLRRVWVCHHTTPGHASARGHRADWPHQTNWRTSSSSNRTRSTISPPTRLQPTTRLKKPPPIGPAHRFCRTRLTSHDPRQLCSCRSLRQHFLRKMPCKLNSVPVSQTGDPHHPSQGMRTKGKPKRCNSL
jgi:hypothetical protein